MEVKKIFFRSAAIKSMALAGLIALLSSCNSGEANTHKPEAEHEEAEAVETISPEKDKGVGPVSELKLEPLSVSLAEKGKAIFDSKCNACHKLDQRYVGPALGDVIERRTPEYIMNMILNSQEMIQKSPTAKALFEEFLTPMPNQNMNQEEARAVLEYFRQVHESQDK